MRRKMTFRLKADTVAVIKRLAKKLDVSGRAVVEAAVHEKAKKETKA